MFRGVSGRPVHLNGRCQDGNRHRQDIPFPDKVLEYGSDKAFTTLLHPPAGSLARQDAALAASCGFVMGEVETEADGAANVPAAEAVGGDDVCGEGIGIVARFDEIGGEHIQVPQVAGVILHAVC